MPGGARAAAPARGAAVQRPSSLPAGKYRGYRPIGLADRTWPERTLAHAPLWCSVDLRDGNQALIDPMPLERRKELFRLLVRLGFKEIEVGMPVSCRDDHDFVRWVATGGELPDDVTPQVLVPMRAELITATVRALRGLPRAVLQVFHPTSAVQRRVVFGASREEVRRLALDGAELAMRLRDRLTGTHLCLQYGPESFTQTEPEFALEVCNAVLDLWRPEPCDDVRVNLPATVESFPPHEFADRIEWMHRNLAHRDRILLGVHPHNDRGGAAAAAEAALLAGADRVEGTLFGNGERSGNLCLVTLAMNLFSQGVDPMLELGDLDGIAEVVRRCTGIPISPRHPWAGEYVYTSLAGSHQDAISKGLRARTAGEPWDVPYLPIDPRDVGRDYRTLVRISNQSGKGGIAHLMSAEHGLELPPGLRAEFAVEVQDVLDERGGELTPDEMYALFRQGFLAPREPRGPRPEAEVVDVVEQPFRGGCAVFCQVRGGGVTRWGAGLDEQRARARRQAVRSGVSRLAAALRRPEPAVASAVTSGAVATSGAARTVLAGAAPAETGAAPAGAAARLTR
ncbi:2-isopropylmalate synthase [Actinomadura verrucosospora]|uniref:2-isopropylmalate synthase n=1 Tax=Actinomadura verrucosospora TaxID=46165 RepID=A0A7D3ZJJ4_ACTVE|nr:2-isopropylmalate synthase [Actinomadura verrucosospora]QKG19903.1 2-isopropylmalate synthase [Actinomadura verrucosospora]